MIRTCSRSNGVVEKEYLRGAGKEMSAEVNIMLDRPARRPGVLR